MKKTPKQLTKDAFGSKDKLVDELMNLMLRHSTIGKDELKKKLKTQSNKKLLALVRREKTLKEHFGSREKLIEAIMSSLLAGKKKEDKGFHDHLKKMSLGKLLDLSTQKAIEKK